MYHIWRERAGGQGFEKIVIWFRRDRRDAIFAAFQKKSYAKKIATQWAKKEGIPMQVRKCSDNCAACKCFFACQD